MNRTLPASKGLYCTDDSSATDIFRYEDKTAPPPNFGQGGDGGKDQPTIWSYYIQRSEQYDKDLVEDVNNTVEVLLVFAGLFFAVVTAFISQMYPMLQQDDDSVRMSTCLALRDSSSITPPDKPFVAPSHAVRINCLLFSGLFTGMRVAMLAMLVKQRARSCETELGGVSSPHLRARIQQRWHLEGIVGQLSLLMHFARFISASGIVAFRNPSWPLKDRGSSTAPLRRGSSSVPIKSSARASTTAESGNEDAFEATNSTRIQGLILPCFKKLMEKRKPANLRGKVVLTDPLKPITRGGYSLIHVGKFGDRVVAVKMLREGKAEESDDRRKSDDELRTEHANGRRIEREINVWAALKHRNICELLGSADDHHDYLVMVSPYYKRGSAANFLKSPVSLDDRKRLTREVCEGLQYLHRFSIVHGDLKPANVLIDDDGVAKLCDFGLVKLEDWEGPPGMTTTSPYSGTMRYKPPELFHGQGIWWPEATFKADMYSLGCVMVEFIEEVRPFNRFDKRKDMEEAIRKHETPVLRTETKIALGDVSDQFWMLLEACWDIAESRRPDVETVVGYLDWF